MTNYYKRKGEAAIVLERDLVCGQVLKRIDIENSSVYKGSRYYFCCPTCKKMFDEKPPAYTDKEGKDIPKINSRQLRLFN